MESCAYILRFPEWADADCSSKIHFVCHEGDPSRFLRRISIQIDITSCCFLLQCLFPRSVPTLKTMIRMKMKTSADITDPATNAQILQQLSAALTRQGLTDFKLKWKTPPRKQKQRTEF
ncbi:hypothetical protein EYF80_068020 [Liparis tanakae]|uniref:Uncharacterized protein n=1 Tax=Liparis tanakae TaxID=230148 RepID=A0A4Z2DZH8_9TELE|nr:hypothetical protein EYF80_068020 [Liparis tanakae]